jgi:hypothetical protein
MKATVLYLISDMRLPGMMVTTLRFGRPSARGGVFVGVIGISSASGWPT